MAPRRNLYKGFADYAAGYTGRTGPNQNTYNPNASGPYAGLADYARGYQASHPQPTQEQINRYKFVASGGTQDMLDRWNAAKNAPTPNPQPFDSIYENAVSGINRQYGDTSAQINYDESQLSPTYGYQSDQAGNVTVDPSNPFSKAALLQRSYDQGQTRSRNQMASQGQLYSGAYQNAQNAGTQGFQQNTDVLKRAYQNAVQNIGQRRRVALTNQSIGTTSAQGDALQRALANRPTS